MRRQGVLENPQSGTTDDVECMFSIMRDLTGKHFTLIEARYTLRKVCIEFAKCLDSDLGFYYFTSTHDRFIEGDALTLTRSQQGNYQVFAIDQGEENDLQT